MCIKRDSLILGTTKASKTVSVRMLRTADAITGGLILKHNAGIFDQAAVQLSAVSPLSRNDTSAPSIGRHAKNGKITKGTP
jgi:hypothetical protein